jgi:hypothetical protein
MTSPHITARRRVIAAAIAALAFGASTASHAAAMPNTIGAGAPQAVPPILPVLSAADRHALRRVEAQKSDRWAYKLPAGARYSTVEMDLFAAVGI